MFLSTSFAVNRTMKMYETPTAQQIDIMKYWSAQLTGKQLGWFCNKTIYECELSILYSREEVNQNA